MYFKYSHFYLIFFIYFYLDAYTISVQTTILCNLGIICLFICYDGIFKHCALLLPGPEWMKNTFIRVCGRHSWVTTPITRSSLFAGPLGIHFSYGMGDESRSVSTNNDNNAFLITSNGVTIGPNSRHIYKGDTWQVISGKGFLKDSRNPAGWPGILCWTFPCRDEMPGHVFQQWRVI